MQDGDWYLKRNEVAEREDCSTHWTGTVNRMPLIWQITVGVLAGSLIAAFAVEYVKQRRVELALQEMQEMQESAQRAVEESARELRLAAYRERVRQQQLDIQEARRMADLRALQQAQAAASEERNAEATRRERAWNKFYQASARCKVEASVECPNEFIRAKRSFEGKYAAGQI